MSVYAKTRRSVDINLPGCNEPHFDHPYRCDGAWKQKLLYVRTAGEANDGILR
jgi:hypothetical protein